MPEKSKPSTGHWPELDQATREARLAAKLRANLARRKQQIRARREEGDAETNSAYPAPALDRKDGAA